MANPFTVAVPSALEALMAGDAGYKGARDIQREQAMQAARMEAQQALSSGGDPRGALARLIGAGDVQGAHVVNQMYQQSPEAVGALERTRQTIQAEFAPKTFDLTTPDGDKITVEKGPDGYRIPKVAGMQPPQNNGTIPADIAALGPTAVKAFKENLAKQRSNIDDKSILDADKAVQAGSIVKRDLTRAIELNKTSYSGPFAKERGYISSQFGGDRGVDTEELTNVVTGQALEKLRAVFGGNPTEGERRILLDVQGAASQAPAVRERIYRRAIAAADARTEFNQRNAEAMRRGTYLQPSPTQTAAPTVPMPGTQPAQAPASQDGPVRISSAQERAALPPGTRYIAPDGQERIKQ